VLALLATIAILWIVLISLFLRPHGMIGSRLLAAGWAPPEIRDLLNACALGILLTVTALIRRAHIVAVLRELGMMPFAWRAVLVTLLAIALTFVLLASLGHVARVGSVNTLLAVGVIGPFIEEVIFRGFLFRQFRHWIGLGFWPAAILASIPFSVAHMYEGSTTLVLLEVMAVTFAGGLLFCWLTERWGTLWAAWSLHAGLNVMFMLFPLGNTAANNLLGNEQRLLIVVLVIAGTLLLTRSTRRSRWRANSSATRRLD